jgi:hypothetical protein
MQLPGQLQQTENEAARAAVTSECSYQSTCHNSCSRALECTKGYRKVWGDSHVSFDTTHRRDVWVLRVRVNTRDIRQVPLVNQLCQKSGCVVCQLSARQVAGRAWWSVRYVRPFNCSLLPTPPPLAECEVAQLVCLRRERLHGLDRDRDLAGEGRSRFLPSGSSTLSFWRFHWAPALPDPPFERKPGAVGAISGEFFFSIYTPMYFPPHQSSD